MSEGGKLSTSQLCLIIIAVTDIMGWILDGRIAFKRAMKQTAKLWEYYII